MHRIWLWVYCNKIPIYPLFCQLKEDYRAWGKSAPSAPNPNPESLNPEVNNGNLEPCFVIPVEFHGILQGPPLSGTASKHMSSIVDGETVAPTKEHEYILGVGMILFHVKPCLKRLVLFEPTTKNTVP